MINKKTTYMKSLVSRKRITLIVLGMVMLLRVQAQQTTTFVFSETAPNQVLREMEKNANSLFAELNRKYNREKSLLNLSLSVVTNTAREKIKAMWECSHFYCTESFFTTSVMKRFGTDLYEVRNIPVCYREGEEEYKRQFFVLKFDRNGKICDFGVTMPQHDYITTFAFGKEVTNEKEREDIQIIEDFIDIFFSAYNCKDLDLLSKMYSEEALIITGKVRKVKYKTHSNNEFSRTLTNNTLIEYSIQNKKEYIEKLKGIFARNEYINIRFDGVEIIQDRKNLNRYGVRLNQYWHVSKKANEKGYYDEGKLFLIIDLTDQDNPEIWVRTWQPFKDLEGNPIHYSEKDYFRIGDFIFE